MSEEGTADSISIKGLKIAHMLPKLVKFTKMQLILEEQN